VKYFFAPMFPFKMKEVDVNYIALYGHPIA
jgi:hypothetical protein